MRILMVDDGGPLQDVLGNALELAGYEVERVTRADEALQLAQLVRWDGLVLDIDLPGMNGLELYARILCYHEHGRLPVLFLTGRARPTLQLALRGAGWAGLIDKPCDGRVLLEELERCLQADGMEAWETRAGGGPLPELENAVSAYPAGQTKPAVAAAGVKTKN